MLQERATSSSSSKQQEAAASDSKRQQAAASGSNGMISTGITSISTSKRSPVGWKMTDHGKSSGLHVEQEEGFWIPKRSLSQDFYARWFHSDLPIKEASTSVTQWLHFFAII